jgi:hypothetical protein
MIKINQKFLGTIGYWLNIEKNTVHQTRKLLKASKGKLLKIMKECFHDDSKKHNDLLTMVVKGSFL